MTFAQQAIIRRINTGTMPLVFDMSQFNQLLDMFETKTTSCLANMYSAATATVRFNDIEIKYMAKFFTELAQFAETHGRLDRLIFGKEEAIKAARESHHV